MEKEEWMRVLESIIAHSQQQYISLCPLRIYIYLHTENGGTTHIYI